VPELTLGRPETPALLPADARRVRPVMLLTLDVPFDRAAATFAVESAAETGAELYVCDGVPVSTGTPAVPAARTFGNFETREACDLIAQEARELGVRTTQILFHHPRPVHAALEVTREQGIGLLVFGSERARIGRWNFWRIARRLRKSAPCLVWIAE
jgi:hypothetical protein